MWIFLLPNKVSWQIKILYTRYILHRIDKKKHTKVDRQYFQKQTRPRSTASYVAPCLPRGVNLAVNVNWQLPAHRGLHQNKNENRNAARFSAFEIDSATVNILTDGRRIQIRSSIASLFDVDEVDRILFILVLWKKIGT